MYSLPSVMKIDSLLPTAPAAVKALDVTVDSSNRSMPSAALRSDSTGASCISGEYSLEVRNASILATHGKVSHALGITTVTHLGVDYHITRVSPYLHRVVVVWLDHDGDSYTDEFSLCGSLVSGDLVGTGIQYYTTILARYANQIEASFSSAMAA